MSNTKKLIEVIQEKREEIIELSKDLYRSTMDGSYFQGWNVGVLAYTDGDISDYYRSQNSFSSAEYEGWAVKVIDYTVHNEVGEIYINKEDLTTEEFENFTKWLLENEYIEESEEAEGELSYRRVSDFDGEYDTDIIDRITKETIEFNTDEYYREAAEEQIDNTLEDLERKLQWEEENEEAQ